MLYLQCRELYEMKTAYYSHMRIAYSADICHDYALSTGRQKYVPYLVTRTAEFWLSGNTNIRSNLIMQSSLDH